jgi:diguanylate cyclase (GGDEF)-like protein
MRVFSTWADETHFDFSAQSGTFRVQVEGPDFYHYDISVTPLLDSRGDLAGRLFVWRDISAQKRSEIEVHEINLHLKDQLEQVELLHDQLRELAIRDSLTGLFNRRYMEETLEREFARAVRENSHLSVVMMDVDKFKMVNDTYGHRAGDDVLRALGNVLLEHIRTGDIACRYGGDEMLMVLPNASFEGAVRRAKELDGIFSELSFKFENITFQTTLSMGVTSFPEQAKTVAELLQFSDTALYFNKNERKIKQRYDLMD